MTLKKELFQYDLKIKFHSSNLFLEALFGSSSSFFSLRAQKIEKYF